MVFILNKNISLVSLCLFFGLFLSFFGFFYGSSDLKSSKRKRFGQSLTAAAIAAAVWLGWFSDFSGEKEITSSDKDQVERVVQTKAYYHSYVGLEKAESNFGQDHDQPSLLKYYPFLSYNQDLIG